MDDHGLISIGQIRTAYGLKGYMKVLSYSGETEHFLKLESIFLEKENTRKQFQVEDIHEKGGILFLKLKGLDSPEAVKIYSNWNIRVPKEYAAPLREGEFYFYDLCKSVLTVDGKKVGVVISVIDNGASNLLEAETEELTAKGTKKVVLIPFVDEFIGEVDTAKKTIELKETWFLE